ncbi:hypothetical protein [Meridianimarinicoccus aquatilis]|uniref:Uncharacterized protein n=1 Tax=Meridianimarinicoccus aquatilis TaxID=2552766 RepID=A0A4R6B0Y8_9RHOB|nr:hypothetical protein [Fluviibacterium aquatile]TDL88133.1 hypothetical protein E2L05_08795 [Fluviibacterium aquatile]
MNNLEFEIVDAPIKEAPFDPALKWTPGLVDYDHHPAYKSLIGTSSLNYGQRRWCNSGEA